MNNGAFIYAPAGYSHALVEFRLILTKASSTVPAISPTIWLSYGSVHCVGITGCFQQYSPGYWSLAMTRRYIAHRHALGGGALSNDASGDAR